jgi:hypothetical protein
LPVVALGVLGLAAGCGSSGSSNTTTSSAQSPQGGSPSSGAPGGTGARPGTTGTISQVNPTSIFVQNPQNGQVTVNYTAKTAFSRTAATTAAALKVGDCVTATAASPSGNGSAAPSKGPVSSLTATNVTITATTRNCTRFGGGAGGPNARPSGAPRANRSFGPSAGARRGGFGGAAFGTVASVGSSNFVVNSVRGKNTTKVTVTTTSATKYQQIESATKSNLKVGLCASAFGTTDDTGAVTARTISLSTPGANGCTMGFGGGRFGMRGGQ